MANIPSIGELSKAIRDFRTGLSLSLPDYLKTTNIMSRMYIEESLYEEDVLIPTISMLNQLYCGYVLTALQLNQYVQGSRTVRDLLELVSTNSYNGDLVNNLTVHQESSGTGVLALDQKEQKLFSGRVISLDIHVPGSSGVMDSTSLKDRFSDDTQNVNADKDVRTTISVMVQLIPYLTASSTLGELLKLNFSPSLDTRFKQARVDEIRFVSDFLFERDLINDRRKALKEDRTGVLYEMLKQQNNALSRAFMRYLGLLPKNHNIANTIMMIDANTFDTACRKASINFSNKKDRDRFFRASFMMKVVVIDPMYSRVRIYSNGQDMAGNYSFNQIVSNANAGSKGSDKYDLQSIMTVMAQGMTPKF